jgi:hypothetical protein
MNRISKFAKNSDWVLIEKWISNINDQKVFYQSWVIDIWYDLILLCNLILSSLWYW